MSVNCKVIKDLLPLYVDEVCSEESRNVIEEHLQGCKSCREEMQLLSAEFKTVPVQTDDKKIVKAANAVIKKGKKKSLFVGCIIAVCAVLILAGAYGGYHFFSSVNGDDLDALAQEATDYLHEDELSVLKTTKKENYLVALLKNADEKYGVCVYEKDEVFKTRWIASGGRGCGVDSGEIASWNINTQGDSVNVVFGTDLSNDDCFYLYLSNGRTFIGPIEKNSVLDIFIVLDADDINGEPVVIGEKTADDLLNVLKQSLN